MKPKFNIYKHITDKFIVGLKLGKIPWESPTINSGMLPMNGIRKIPYRGINIPLCWAYCEINNWQYPLFFSYKDITKIKAKIKDGQQKQHNMIVFWTWFDIKDKDDKIKKVPYLRYYNVWNLAQLDDVDKKYIPKIIENKIKSNKEIDEFITKTKADIHYDSIRGYSYYSPSSDSIHLEPKNQFKSDCRLYKTSFHELVHWTGHESRLNRKNEENLANKQNYSKEELIAEIGASFLTNEFNIDSKELTKNSQSYINGWISNLENNPRWIVQAGGAAQKASDYLHGKVWKK